MKSRRNGARYVKHSEAAGVDLRLIEAEIFKQWPRFNKPRWASESMEMVIDYRPIEGRCDVVVRPLRPAPKGVTGRNRDLHNLVDAIADALQLRGKKTGIGVVKDDNQFSRVVLTRRDADGNIL